MTAIITEIIIVIATAIATFSIEMLSQAISKKYKAVVPKKKRNKLRAMLVTKYAFLAISIISIVFFVPFGKTFVVSMFCIGLLCSYFFARDVLFYTVSSVNINFETEQVDKDIQLWLSQLARCDKTDKERQQMIIDKLNTLQEQRKLL